MDLSPLVQVPPIEEGITDVTPNANPDFIPVPAPEPEPENTDNITPIPAAATAAVPQPGDLLPDGRVRPTFPEAIDYETTKKPVQSHPFFVETAVKGNRPVDVPISRKKINEVFGEGAVITGVGIGSSTNTSAHSVGIDVLSPGMKGSICKQVQSATGKSSAVFVPGYAQGGEISSHHCTNYETDNLMHPSRIPADNLHALRAQYDHPDRWFDGTRKIGEVDANGIPEAYEVPFAKTGRELEEGEHPWHPLGTSFEVNAAQIYGKDKYREEMENCKRTTHSGGRVTDERYHIPGQLAHDLANAFRNATTPCCERGLTVRVTPNGPSSSQVSHVSTCVTLHAK